MSNVWFSKSQRFGADSLHTSIAPAPSLEADRLLLQLSCIPFDPPLRLECEGLFKRALVVAVDVVRAAH